MYMCLCREDKTLAGCRRHLCLSFQSWNICIGIRKRHIHMGKHWTLIYSIYTHIHIYVRRTLFITYIFRNKNKNVNGRSVELGFVELWGFK